MVTDHKLIAMRYLKGWFVVDLLATFPVDYIVRAVEVRGSERAQGREWMRGGDARGREGERGERGGD